VRALSSSLRKRLETAVLTARRAAENASRAAIDGLGVFADARPDHLVGDQIALRNGLRAKLRQLEHDGELLVAECAYEQWHRLLFARFLAENQLLLHPLYWAPVTIADCDELAADLGEPDGWAVAARFAAEILPGIFRLDDPCVRLRLAPEGRQALEQILDSLPAEVFAAYDALGWVYQFWQKDKKDEVNASGRKIGGADLGPVTQLFTEYYMVRFLLENTLGAWWANRNPGSPLIESFLYLRLDSEGKPAAGTFESWPECAAEITVMDPCCGSGHFLVEVFTMLSQMRAEEEGLSAAHAGDAVIRDNLFGLELDPRCTEIAAFALALSAWKQGGYRELPQPNIACSGISAAGQLADWHTLATRDDSLANALTSLHKQFAHASDLGSLIDPRRVTDQADLFRVAYDEVAPVVEGLLVREQDPQAQVAGWAAAGIARSASLLARTYTLVATNVPYLARGKHNQVLKDFCDLHHPEARADLAACFLERSRRFTDSGGTYALVTPQAWLFLSKYAALRQDLLSTQTVSVVARLGARSFEEITGEVVKPILFVATDLAPAEEARFVAIDAEEGADGNAKGFRLRVGSSLMLNQASQRKHPDSRIALAPLDAFPPLGEVADGIHGLGTKDAPRFIRYFWELPYLGTKWEPVQSTVSSTRYWGGMEHVVMWDQGLGILHKRGRVGQAILAGRMAYGKPGVLVSQMGDLPCTLYQGGHFDKNAAVISPSDPRLLSAVWAFCSSSEYPAMVRQIDAGLKVTNRTLVKVPFDFERWRALADDLYPTGLPEPYSRDPTQWLFKGDPTDTTERLQVAVARLLSYHWPAQKPDELDEFADADGIVCLPSVAGEPPAAERLQSLLGTVFGEAWSLTLETQMLEETGSKKKSLDDWLRDDFFRQHCSLFGNRPFVWHIWDGQRYGFSALVNYHRLNRKLLEKLTYTYLGQDWVERQKAAVRDEVPGAEERLMAALELQRKLKVILDGEKPYDIYVRWKELHEQPVGWEPDVNNGVRLNIRPFVTAGVLRTFSPWPFKAAVWKKDRGKESDGSERHNDVHLSLAEKLASRKQAGQA
jgi:hypothetical protein